MEAVEADFEDLIETMKVPQNINCYQLSKLLGMDPLELLETI